MRSRTACFVFALAFALVASGMSMRAQAGELQTIDEVLARINKPVTAEPKGPSDAAKLLLDITEFRGRSATLEVERAATDWLALWDRARAIDPELAAADYGALDMATQRPVSSRTVMAALPRPEVWPAIRKQANARVKQSPDDASALGLQFIAEFLLRDAAALKQTVDAFERLALAGSPTVLEFKRHSINHTRAQIYKLYGTREEIADGFRAHVEARARQTYTGLVEVPDLVGLLGAAKAEALLAEVLRKPVSLRIPQGDATRLLAQKLVLKDIDSLRKPQWGLIDDIGTAALYEAMQKRFVPVVKDDNGSAAEVADAETDYLRRYADLYYFLDLVLAGRDEDAERAMARATQGRGDLGIPKEGMAALIRSGKNEAVYAFLAKTLLRRPQLPAWDVYLDQAGYLGRSKEALALIDAILLRTDLAAYLRADLQAKRLDALLGADQVNAAVEGFRSLLAAPPVRDEATLAERSKAAIRLAGIGRILRQLPLAETGFSFAKQAMALPVKSQETWRAKVLTDLMAELRRQGRSAEAQALALTELERDNSDPRFAGLTDLVPDPAKRVALVELAGIYDAAHQSLDVLRLLSDVSTWAADDVRAVIAEQDSLGVPLGLMAARALKASGDAAAAQMSLLTLLGEMPAYDLAYQLLVDLNPEEAISELDGMYALDQFEERPLIWKAKALSISRQYDAAEKVIRRAIAIDPSDGEQGPKDRMRAYAILADILEAKGDTKAAQEYRRAVKAIRISEQADELRKLGLHQRAFSGYSVALDEFSDAYCIQSRMALQLGKMGFHDEALKHYRRAYELMPESFGRVESHCFGCEGVFVGPNAQAVAEQVFTRLVKQTSTKPQAPYMLGYLRMEQGRYGEAVGLFRQAVGADSEYLNAWKHLHDLGDKTYIDAGERDIARLRLLELDPYQHHVKYRLSEVADVATLWHALARLEAQRAKEPKVEQVYRLTSSAQKRAEAIMKLPLEMRVQMERYIALQDKVSGQEAFRNAMPSLADHSLVLAALQLMGDGSDAD